MNRWRISPNVARVDSGTRVVALPLTDPEVEVPLAFEGSAGEIWRILEAAGVSGISESVLFVELSELFQVPASEISSEVSKFLTRLQHANLAHFVSTDDAERGQGAVD